MKTLIAAYVLSVVVYAFPAYWLQKFLYSTLDKGGAPHPHRERIPWIAVVTGMIERSIIVTLILIAPRMLTTFLGAWLALKVAGGWGLLKEPTTENRATFVFGLWGTVLSYACAIVCGLWIAPNVLDIINSPSKPS